MAVRAFLSIAALVLLGAAAPQPAPAGITTHPCTGATGKLDPLRDFGQLCRYQAANAALPPASGHRVVFFGDSITEIWIESEPGLFTHDVLDRGISGQTTAQMLVRFREDVIDLHPQVVHILAGTNDIAGNTGPTSLTWIENNLMTMTELAQAHGIKVVLGSVLPASRYFWRPSVHPVEAIAALNAWMRGYAKRAGAVYVDYYSALQNSAHGFKRSLTIDGVHPNAAGFAVMRPLAVRGIETADPAIRLDAANR